jgi:hypothetical protein
MARVQTWLYNKSMLGIIQVSNEPMPAGFSELVKQQTGNMIITKERNKKCVARFSKFLVSKMTWCYVLLTADLETVASDVGTKQQYEKQTCQFESCINRRRRSLFSATGNSHRRSEKIFSCFDVRTKDYHTSSQIRIPSC